MMTTAPVRVGPAASPVARAVAAPRRARRFPLLGHSPALDGLRGLAVLLVLIYHFAGQHVLHGGWAGVDIFFCLSGFLITALILDERRVYGRLDVRRFYARRACRLLPALVAFLGLWALLLLAFHDQNWLAATPSGDGVGRQIDVPGAFRDLGIALLYGANWDVISGTMTAPLPHLWSLAVEEQFYLVWPALLLTLLLIRKPSVRLAVVGAMIAVSTALPWLYWDGGAGMNRIYFGTDTRAVGLLAGAFAALVWHERQALGRASRLARTRAGMALTFVLVVAWYLGNAPAKFLVMPALLGLAVSQVVPYLTAATGALPRVLSVRWLVWCGKRSYALYLWQYAWATWTHPLGMWPGIPLGILGTFACAQLSWVVVEAPILGYARRFRPAHAPTATPAVPLRLAA
jgi:peptidoglycan/LPS O-acetylase OafA/YrhL